MAPSTFCSGFNWTAKFLEEWDKLSSDQKNKAGLCFCPQEGRRFKNSAVVKFTQEAMKGAAENEELLSTCSWRQYTTSLALAMEFTAPERIALGDWQEAAPGGVAPHDVRPITLR